MRRGFILAVLKDAGTMPEVKEELWMYVGIQICSGMSIAAALYMFGENVFMLVMTIASALAVIL